MFDCVRLKPSSPLTLRRDPLYECNTSNPAFAPMLFFCIVGFCFALAVPVWVYVFVQDLHKTGRINHPTILLEFGTLYDIYSLKYSYWEAVVMSRKLLMLIILISIQNAPAQTFLTALLSALYTASIWKWKPFRVVWIEIGSYHIDFLNQMELLCSVTVFVNYFLAFVSALNPKTSVAAGYMLLLSNILVILVIIGALLFRVYLRNATFAKEGEKNIYAQAELTKQNEVELVLFEGHEGAQDPLAGVLDERYSALKSAYMEVLTQYKAGLQSDSFALEQVETLRPVLFRTFAALHDYIIQQRDAAEAKSSPSHADIVTFLSSIESAQATVVNTDKGDLVSEVKAWERLFAENTLVGLHQLFLRRNYDILFSCWSNHNRLIRSGIELVLGCAKCAEFGLAFSLRNTVMEARVLPREKGNSLVELIADKQLAKEYQASALKAELNLKELQLSSPDKSLDDR